MNAVCIMTSLYDVTTNHIYDVIIAGWQNILARTLVPGIQSTNQRERRNDIKQNYM